MDSSVHEAAGRLRESERRRHAHDEDFDEHVCMDDFHAVAKAYLAETDPTPITPELLKADGLTQSGDFFECDTAKVVRNPHGWFFSTDATSVAGVVSTMGHVRTMLRLTKGGGE